MNGVDPKKMTEAIELLTRTHAFAAELAANTYTLIIAKQVREAADKLDSQLKKIRHEGYKVN